MPALLARYGVASVGLALVADGRVVLGRAYGAQAAGTPATPATLYGLASVTKPVSAGVLLRVVAAGRLAFAFAPGAAYAYSGEGYDYAARFAERKLGRIFEDLAEETVFGPVGMRSTAYSRRGWMRGRLAAGLDSAGRWGEPERGQQPDHHHGPVFLHLAAE